MHMEDAWDTDTCLTQATSSQQNRKEKGINKKRSLVLQLEGEIAGGERAEISRGMVTQECCHWQRAKKENTVVTIYVIHSYAFVRPPLTFRGPPVARKAFRATVMEGDGE
jgi:hypothetical protein